MKKIDFQQLLLEKGERIGLCAAGGLAFILLALTLFMPGKGLFSGTASGHIEELTSRTKKLQEEHSRARPTEGSADYPGPLKDTTEQFKVRHVASNEFQARSLFFPPPITDTKRQQPLIEKADEVKVAFVRGQFPAMQFQYDETSGKRVIIAVLVLKGESADSGSTQGGFGTTIQGDRFKQMYQGLGQGFGHHVCGPPRFSRDVPLRQPPVRRGLPGQRPLRPRTPIGWPPAPGHRAATAPATARAQSATGSPRRLPWPWAGRNRQCRR